MLKLKGSNFLQGTVTGDLRPWFWLLHQTTPNIFGAIYLAFLIFSKLSGALDADMSYVFVLLLTVTFLQSSNFLKATPKPKIVFIESLIFRARRTCLAKILT